MQDTKQRPATPHHRHAPGAPDARHLNQIQLSRRWSLSPRTLERWRWLKQGPDYVKVGGRVLYRLNDIESFEAANLRHLVSETPGRDFGRGGRR